MNYLLDTCVVSDFFKRNPAVIRHFDAISPDNVHISSVTVMEIEYGLKQNFEREIKIRPLWKNLLKYIHVISYSPQCATASALIRAELKNKGLPIGPYDILIAGSSLAHNMILVTSNLNEFKRIPHISIENWRD